MNNENEIQPRHGHDARASTSPLRGRTAHSMYAPAPAPVPTVHQPIRRVVTAPPVYHSPPVYGPDPNLIYGAPAPVYGAPLPYIPQYAPNTSMYYPPQIAQPQVVIRQTQMAPAYGNYDPNFQAYFGADVMPQGAQSPIDQQREQYEMLSRNRVSRVDSSYNSRSQSSMQATMDAEARQLREAIQLSLTESSRRASRPANSVTSEYESGFTTRTNSTRSAVSGVSGLDLRGEWDAESTIAPASTNMTPEELADEKALQEAIMESIREAEREQDRILSPRSRAYEAETARYEAPLSFVKPTPAAPVDRQYPYNLDSNVRRLTSPEKSRPVRGESAYLQSHHSQGYERASSTHRRQEPISPRHNNNDDDDNFEYYPEARRTSTHHESQYTGYDVHTSPRDLPVEETRGRTLHRRTASGRDFYDREEHHQGPRRTSSGRDFNPDSPRQLKGRTASCRDFVEHNVRGRTVRKTPSGRDFMDSDYHPYDPRRNIGTSPEVAAAVRALVSEKSITEQRSTSASRARAYIRTDYEDSDYSREYPEGRPLARRPSLSPSHGRVASSQQTTAQTTHHISSQMSSSGISAAEAAESRYTRTSPDFSKFANTRQGRIYDSPQTSEDDLSSHEEIPAHKLPLPARPVLPPPPVFRQAPPVFGHATLRAPTPPPPLQRMVSGTKHIQ